jgi:hypothetical protein
VFAYPHIVKMRLACKMKLYQTALISVALPVSLKCLAMDYCGPSTVAALAGISFVSLSVLTIVGEVFRKFVGKIYMRHDGDRIIISHLTFFGNRAETAVFVKDVVPLSESSETEDELVWKMHLYDGRT